MFSRLRTHEVCRRRQSYQWMRHASMICWCRYCRAHYMGNDQAHLLVRIDAPETSRSQPAVQPLREGMRVIAFADPFPDRPAARRFAREFGKGLEPSLPPPREMQIGKARELRLGLVHRAPAVTIEYVKR